MQNRDFEKIFLLPKTLFQTVIHNFGVLPEVVRVCRFLPDKSCGQPAGKEPEMPVFSENFMFPQFGKMPIALRWLICQKLLISV